MRDEASTGIGVHRDPFTDEIVASDTFEVPAQGKFYIAGEEVSERVYRRYESLCGDCQREGPGLDVHLYPWEWGEASDA